MKFRFGRGVNRVHLAVAGREDEIFPGGHRRVRVAEKIKREDDEQHPQHAQHAGQAQDERADDCAASHATASSSSTAAPDRPMSFSAACAALPECFTAAR